MSRKVVKIFDSLVDGVQLKALDRKIGGWDRFTVESGLDEDDGTVLSLSDLTGHSIVGEVKIKI